MTRLRRLAEVEAAARAEPEGRAALVQVLARAALEPQVSAQRAWEQVLPLAQLLPANLFQVGTVP